MRRNNKKKGFTIVELVIVIAVIAILAALLIPTFASIIARANESADIQAVRQMNIALMAESVENPPDGIRDVINILAAAGYNAKEKLIPVSSKHGFYWCKPANMITLIRDEGDNTPELIFPVENAAIDAAFEAAVTANPDFTNKDATKSNGFYDLQQSYEDNPPTTGDEEGSNENLSPAEALIAALTTEGKTGKFTLNENINLSLAALDEIDCTAGANNNPLVIDLNKKTLTIEGTVSLKIFNNITIENGNIIITDIRTYGYEDDDDAFISIYDKPGLSVTSTGTLSLNNVTVSEGRDVGLYNEGNISLTSTNLLLEGIKQKTVREGTFGLKNSGTATINSSTFTSTNYAQPIDNTNGKISVENTKFIEGEVVNYISNSPVYIRGGTASLTSLDFSKSKQSIFALNGTRVTISDCSKIPAGTLGLIGEDTVYIFKDFDGGKDPNAAIRALSAAADKTTYWTVVETVVNGVTTYTAGWKLTPGNLRDTLPYNDEDGTLTINAGDTVTMHLGPNGFRVKSPVNVYGTLKFVVGVSTETCQLYGDANNTDIDITVQSGGTLEFGAGINYQVDNNGSGSDLDGQLATFISDYVTNNGGTINQP